MIDKFCAYLTKKIRKEMPEVDDERAEVIMYGLQTLRHILIVQTLQPTKISIGIMQLL